MGALKAPGDGLNALFYQSQWDVVGNSVIYMVKNFFDPQKISKINETLIVLIPK